MKIEVGDKFIKDTTEFDTDFRLSWEIVDIKYSWDLIETICYKCSDPTGTFLDTVFEKSKQEFEILMRYFNTRRIPKDEIGDIKTYVPKHKFK